MFVTALLTFQQHECQGRLASKVVGLPQQQKCKRSGRSRGQGQDDLGRESRPPWVIPRPSLSFKAHTIMCRKHDVQLTPRVTKMSSLAHGLHVALAGRSAEGNSRSLPPQLVCLFSSASPEVLTLGAWPLWWGSRGSHSHGFSPFLGASGEQDPERRRHPLVAGETRKAVPVPSPALGR